jgi:hypothetical protein
MVWFLSLSVIVTSLNHGDYREWRIASKPSRKRERRLGQGTAV